MGEHHRRSGGGNVMEQVAALFWPTPRASEHDQGKETRESVLTGNDCGRGPTLSTAARAIECGSENWPTPTAETSQCNGSHRGVADTLYSAVNESQGKRVSLNPTWVEHLQGFPEGWTELDGPLASDKSSTRGKPRASRGSARTAPSDSTASATPSSRKSGT